ncbi:hypothetical protein Tco_1322964 [Tanacetum coccineum]
MGDDVDISTLTMEQYMALIQDNIRPDIVKPEIDGIDDEDAHEHMRRVLEILDLFHFPSVTHDAFMLRVFPITLSGPALRWKNRLSAGLITTWDLLEKIFYTGLDIPTRIRLDSKEFIPLMSPTQALKSIQVMAGHSHSWYDEATTRKSISDSLDNVDTKNLKENIHTIQKYMKEPVPHDLHVVQPYVPPTPFSGHLKKQKDNPYKTRETVGIPEKIHKKKAQEDEGNMDDGWYITIKDVERLRQIRIPTIQTLPNLELVVQPYMPRGPVCDEVKVVREEELEYDIPLRNGVMQPLTPQTVRITLPDDDYVAPPTSPILDKHLNEFGEEFFDITRVVKKADGNLVNDLSDIIKTYDFETFIRKLLHQVNQSSHETGLFRDFKGNEVAREAFNENSSHVAIT